MAFTQAGTLDPHGGPVLVRKTIANSTTVTRNDALQISSGFIALGAAASDVFGHANDISTKGGVGVVTDGSAGADLGSYNGTFTTASDNQTVDEVKAEVDISKNTLYSAELDAAAGTTTGSDLAGYYMNLADEESLDESTALATGGQYHSFGLDPQDNSRVIVNIFESHIFGVQG